MKTALPYGKLIVFLLASFIISTRAVAAPENIPAGSFIVNMGVVPQTYGNGVKPWGMIHDLIQNHKVQVKWIINPNKQKDGTDFTYAGTEFKGGTFIILAKYRTAAVNARIAYWQSQGVVGVTTTEVIDVDVAYTLKYTPRWTFDYQNGNIALNYLVEAGIPTTNYPKKYPSELNSCDDLFVMPHAEPTWAEHNNLFHWNKNHKGWIWYGCHAGSVIENLVNPLDSTQRMNFLSSNGLVPDRDHEDASPPYSYRFPTDPEMQFMGKVDGAVQNGMEQVYLPSLNSSWRPTTKVAVYDPTQANIPALSNGDAAIVAYGPAFGDPARGQVMMQAGHNFDKNSADAVAAMRAFFNFSFMSVAAKVIPPTLLGPATMGATATANFSVALPAGNNMADFHYRWTSSCGGTFSDPYGVSTSFTPGSMDSCGTCTVMVTVSDLCGRTYYQTADITICPLPPVAISVTTPMIINDPGTTAKTVGEVSPLAGTDEDGYVTTYLIQTLPPASAGVLSYDHDNSASTADAAITALPAAGLSLTKAQAKSLKFDPVDNYGGSVVFNYKVYDNIGLPSANTATYTIPVNPPPTTKTFICTPVNSDADMSSVCPLHGNDNNSVSGYRIVTLPPANKATIYLFGVPVDVNDVLTVQQSSQLKFKPSGSYLGYAEITYVAVDNQGTEDQTPATLTLQIVNQPPVPNDVSAPAIADSIGMMSIPALSATDLDGTVVSFTITNAPPANTGTLFFDNAGTYSPVDHGKVLTPAQAASLKFDPVDTYTGVVKFKYTATDNGGLTAKTPATYSIPVRKKVPVANDVIMNGVYTGSNMVTINPVVGSDPDTLSQIVGYIISSLPNASKGTLYVNYDTAYLPATAGMNISVTQASTLKFSPVPSFTGSYVFRYTVKNTAGEVDPTPAKYTINVINGLPSAINVENEEIYDTCGIRNIKPLKATDPDGSIASYMIVSLPKPNTGVLSLNGSPVTVGQMLNLTEATQLEFDPAAPNSDDAKFKFTAIDNFGLIDQSAAEFKIPIKFWGNKKKPKSKDVINAPFNMKAEAKRLQPMAAIDTDGVITTYQLKRLPNQNEGKVYLMGIPVSNNQRIAADKADKLTFVPTGSYKGNSDFDYKSFDDDGQESDNQGKLQMVLNNSKPVAVDRSIQQIRKNTTVAIPGMSATDEDGTVASYKVLSLPTNGVLLYDSTGTGVYKNVTLNKTLSPAQAAKLKFNSNQLQVTSSFTYSVKDNVGDTSVAATYSIPVGSFAANQKPIINDIRSAAIPANAGMTAVSPLTGSDLDGTIAYYNLESVPPVYYGRIYYNSGGSVYDSIPIASFKLTVAQAATLKFKPSGTFVGDVVLRYRAVDDQGETSESYATITIPITTTEPVAVNVTNAAIPSSGGAVSLSALQATSLMPIRNYVIFTLPNENQGTLILDGMPVTLNQLIPVTEANRLEFDPSPSFSGTATFTYSVFDDAGNVDQTPATFSIPVTNQAPEAKNILSQVITNYPNTPRTSIPALSGVDNDGSISSFVITSLPTKGTLYRDSVAISSLPSAGVTLSASDASKLSFKPATNASGTASFTYTAKDNSGNVSNVATYSIPLNVPPVTNDVTTMPLFANPIRMNIAPLSGSDDVGIVFYTITALPDATDGKLYLNNIAITSLSQVATIPPADINKLSFLPAAGFEGTRFTYTATDNLGIIDVTPAVYTIPYNNTQGTLPIELIKFDGMMAGKDNLLTWSTSQEINSSHFELEYSTDGTSFNRLANVAAKGNSSTTSEYNYRHTNVVSGIANYRLKMVDANGSSKYSKVVSLNRKDSRFHSISIYPNPFAGKLTVSLESETDKPAILTLIDLSGKVMVSQVVKMQKGPMSIMLDNLTNLNSGFYMLNLRNEDLDISQKIMKMR